MSLNRLSRWDLLTVLAAVALLASLGMTWFDPSADDEVVFSVSPVDAWDGVGGIARALAAIAILCLLLVLVRGSRLKRRTPLAPWIAVLGFVALVLVLVRLIEPPELGNQIAGLERGPGIWLALAASIGLVLGGRRAMVAEGTSFGREADRFSKPLPRRRTPARPARRRTAPNAPPRPRPVAGSGGKAGPRKGGPPGAKREPSGR